MRPFLRSIFTGSSRYYWPGERQAERPFLPHRRRQFEFHEIIVMQIAGEAMFSGMLFFFYFFSRQS